MSAAEPRDTISQDGGGSADNLELGTDALCQEVQDIHRPKQKTSSKQQFQGSRLEVSVSRRRNQKQSFSHGSASDDMPVVWREDYFSFGLLAVANACIHGHMLIISAAYTKPEFLWDTVHCQLAQEKMAWGDGLKPKAPQSIPQSTWRKNLQSSWRRL